MKKLIIAAFALTALPLVTACNTVSGVGKDVKAGGEAIEKTADKVKDEISD
ncbi:MAG: entericidin A/B family lipoprotein [Hyphomonas sp.]|uniref:entericidin A/B family lipoprotein n=1 Tax=Hyphomonas sp. TaxID=87 RepID=UPI00352748F9